MKIKDAIRNTSMMALGTLALGCATAGPTPELVDAREAYKQASTGVANEFAPDRVHQAKMSLEQAERAHDEKPGSVREQHYAYVAHREALSAMEQGTQKSLEEQKKNYEDEYVKALERQRDEAYALLGQAASSIQSARAQQEMAQRQYEDAMKSLEQFAQIRHEKDRGTVITLNGQVLFEFNKAKLLPIAEKRLEKVAVALKDPSTEGQIRIEGHTDAIGSDQYNMKLSKERAQAVREFLISKGVSPDRISAHGEGESQPIASNDTPEGRANNRRVEIVLEGEQLAQR